MRAELAVYFIAGTQDIVRGTLPGVLEEALKAGITCFQYREKGAGSLQTASERKEMALECQQLCTKYQVPFIINDDVALALEIGAAASMSGKTTRKFAKLSRVALEK